MLAGVSAVKIVDLGGATIQIDRLKSPAKAVFAQADRDTVDGSARTAFPAQREKRAMKFKPKKHGVITNSDHGYEVIMSGTQTGSQTRIQSVQNEFSCGPCGITCSSAKQLKEHLRGAKHRHVCGKDHPSSPKAQSTMDSTRAHRSKKIKNKAESQKLNGTKPNAAQSRQLARTPQQLVSGLDPKSAVAQVTAKTKAPQKQGLQAVHAVPAATRMRQTSHALKALKCLLRAVRDDDADATRQLLATAADVNAAAEQPFEEDSDDEFEMLLPVGQSPVHVAASHGSAEALAILLEHGADPNLQDRSQAGLRPIHMVSSPDALLVLLNHGADVASLDVHGRAALHHTTTPTVAINLLANGADPTHVDKEGKNAAVYKSSISSVLADAEEGLIALPQLNQLGCIKILSDWKEASKLLPRLQALRWMSCRHHRLAMHPERGSYSMAAVLPAAVVRMVGELLGDRFSRVEADAAVNSRFVWHRFTAWLGVQVTKQRRLEIAAAIEKVERLWPYLEPEGRNEFATRLRVGCEGLGALLATGPSRPRQKRDKSTASLHADVRAWDDDPEQYVDLLNASDLPELNRIAVGSAVTIDGLTAAPELNGRSGLVKGFDRRSGRYMISIEGEERLKKLRPANVLSG
eukprot:SAG11_NODE_874_length_6773_cov_4.639114_7_plen_634_part_00